MNLYRMESNPLGIERISAFLEDNYVSVGYPGIGDLENIGIDELKARLISAYHYEESELTDHLEAILVFVHTMQDGDYVLVRDGQYVHLGDLGDYFYNELFDTADIGTCHRRGVTWLKSLPMTDLNAEVQGLISSDGVVVQYKGSKPSARMDLWLTSPSVESNENDAKLVDDETISMALHILKEALVSEDADRRERAAIAILQFVK